MTSTPDPDNDSAPALPPVVDAESWRAELGALRAREKAATRFVVVTQGEIGEALAYREKVGNQLAWFSTADSHFGADMDAPAGGGFGLNVFLRDGDRVYRTWHTGARGSEQLSHTFAFTDLLPYGRHEEWQDVPDGWPQQPTYTRWPSSEDIAAHYGRTPA